MRLLVIILFLSFKSFGQSATIYQTTKTLNIKAYNRSGTQIGFFSFDSLSGKIVRSGDQVTVFRRYIRANVEMQKRLDLADYILSMVDTTGKILYPIEFKEAIRRWNY